MFLVFYIKEKILLFLSINHFFWAGSFLAFPPAGFSLGGAYEKEVKNSTKMRKLNKIS